MKQILDKGPSLKLFKEAHQFYVDGFEDQALSRYIYLASQGFEIANFNAGFILEKTKDPKHFQRAAFFYFRSAQMGNAEARKKVGDAYSKLEDKISAIAHYVVAANGDNPDPEALFNLGYAYETGIGLKKDLLSAIDAYTASMSVGKSGKMAVYLALAKVRIKLFIEDFKKSRLSGLKRRKPTLLRSRKDSNKVVSMVATLLLIGIIYWYINYFQPRQERLQNAQNARRNFYENPVRPNYSNSTDISTKATSTSVHSDSSADNLNLEPTEFRFRQNNEYFTEEVSDE